MQYPYYSMFVLTLVLHLLPFVNSGFSPFAVVVSLLFPLAVLIEARLRKKDMMAFGQEHKILSLFILFYLSSFFFSINLLNSVLPTVQIISLLLGILFTTLYHSRQECMKNVEVIVMRVGLCISILMLSSVFHILPRSLSNYSLFELVYDHYLGVYYLGVSVLFTLQHFLREQSKSTKLFFGISFAIHAVAILISLSRTTYFFFAGLLSLYVWNHFRMRYPILQSKRAISCLLAIICICAYVGLSKIKSFDEEPRFQYVQQAIEVIVQHPLGIGAGNFIYFSKHISTVEEQFAHFAHAIIFDLSIEAGVGAGTLFVLLSLRLILKLKQAWKLHRDWDWIALPAIFALWTGTFHFAWSLPAVGTVYVFMILRVYWKTTNSSKKCETSFFSRFVVYVGGFLSLCLALLAFRYSYSLLVQPSFALQAIRLFPYDRSSWDRAFSSDVVSAIEKTALSTKLLQLDHQNWNTVALYFTYQPFYAENAEHQRIMQHLSDFKPTKFDQRLVMRKTCKEVLRQCMGKYEQCPGTYSAFECLSVEDGTLRAATKEETVELRQYFQDFMQSESAKSIFSNTQQANMLYWQTTEPLYIVPFAWTDLPRMESDLRNVLKLNPSHIYAQRLLYWIQRIQLAQQHASIAELDTVSTDMHKQTKRFGMFSIYTFLEARIAYEQALLAIQQGNLPAAYGYASKAAKMRPKIMTYSDLLLSLPTTDEQKKRDSATCAYELGEKCVIYHAERQKLSPASIFPIGL